MTCKICGADMPDDATFCPSCGCNNKLDSNSAFNNNSVFTQYSQISKGKMPKSLIQLVIEVISSIFIIFIGAIILIFGSEKSGGIFPIVIGFLLLYMLVKNPPISKKENIQNYKEIKKANKPQGASRIAFLVISVIVAFLCLLMCM